jgi:hypothetical protein
VTGRSRVTMETVPIGDDRDDDGADPELATTVPTAQ